MEKTVGIYQRLWLSDLFKVLGKAAVGALNDYCN